MAVRIDIGIEQSASQKTFALPRIADEWAHAKNATDNANLLTAMQSANTLAVRGISSQGIVTLDGFWLTGFNNSLALAEATCNQLVA